MKKHLAALGVALLFSVGAHASTLLGPEGQFSAIFSRLEWEPGSGCFKPYRPYQMDGYERENYVREAQEYLRCIKRQADSDAKYAAEVVYEGYNEAADDFIREVETGY